MAGGVEVSIAFNSVTLDDTPTWTALVASNPNLVAGYDLDCGRQFEFDRTDGSTATVTINDRDGLLDPTNTTGPYFGLLEPLLQIKIDLWNPITEAWSTRFRGFIEELDYSVHPSVHLNVSGDPTGVTSLTISCVDLFAILTAIEMQPGAFGDVPPADSEGNVFFIEEQAQDRIEGVLADAGIPTAFAVVFSLNVVMQASVYAPSENVLQVIQDACDAEFPTVSNVYVDRLGRLAVHGRLAKFDPVGTAAGAGAGVWFFTYWKAGDGQAVAASPTDTAHVRTLAFNRGLSKVINSAFCTPNNPDNAYMTEAEVEDQLVVDAASIAQFGIRSWSAENLLIEEGGLTGNDAKTECQKFAEFISTNYAQPLERITDISFRSMRPDAVGAAANWDLLCEADISDLIDVTVKFPGDSDGTGGFTAEAFFIEGIHEEARPLNGEYADVTLRLDLSPQAHFDNPVGLDGST